MPHECPVANFTTDSKTTACFTGHRPKSIPLDYDDEYNRNALTDVLYERASIAYKLGYRTFITGMAEGIDTLAAFAVDRLKKEHDDVRLIAAIPFRGRLKTILRKPLVNQAYELCDEAVIVCEGVGNWTFLSRDRYMVDHSSYLIAAVTEVESGTGYTLNYAIKRDLNIDVLSLVSVCQKITADRPKGV